MAFGKSEISRYILFAIDQSAVSVGGCGPRERLKLVWSFFLYHPQVLVRTHKQKLKLPFLLAGMWQRACKELVPEHMLLFTTIFCFASSVQML